MMSQIPLSPLGDMVNVGPDWESVLQTFGSDPLAPSFEGMDKQTPRTERLFLQSNSAMQVLTPPLSQYGSPVDEDVPEENTLISISTTFYPGAQLRSEPPDIVLFSSDSVFFYVHSHVLLAVSDNGFGNALLQPTQLRTPDQDNEAYISLPENSTILNIILHTVYEISCTHYSPTFANLTSAVNHLRDYGISPKSCMAPSMPLYNLLLLHAPVYPLELYALAAMHDLFELAAATSSHLLSFSLPSLTDEMAERIGPVYLKRLFFLHFGRSDALKRVLLPPPYSHPPTPTCDFNEQQKLTRAWALASAYLAWDARPDLSTSLMESSLRPLADHLTCEQCQQALRDRIKHLIVQWSVVKRTI